MGFNVLLSEKLFMFINPYDGNNCGTKTLLFLLHCTLSNTNFIEIVHLKMFRRGFLCADVDLFALGWCSCVSFNHMLDFYWHIVMSMQNDLHVVCSSGMCVRFNNFWDILAF